MDFGCWSPWSAVGVAGFIAPRAASAQDVAITNARIVVGNGPVIENGHHHRARRQDRVGHRRHGRHTQGLQVIDAKGMTAMPGFIDGHKHINTGPNEKAQMQSLLEAGYTTILSGGGPGDGNIPLRDKIDKGEINGPRIIPSERVNLRRRRRKRARPFRRWRPRASSTPARSR